jgi:hypothetical protein
VTTVPYDNPVFTVLTDILDCLCSTISTDGLPTPCVCTVYPGEGASFDYTGDCGDDACGSAWVRLDSAEPSNGIGVVNTEPNNCGAGLGVVVEVGIVRCLTPMADDGSPLPAEELLAASGLQVADMYAMRKALVCCGHDLVLGPYLPVGPQGGVVGGVWTASLMED